MVGCVNGTLVYRFLRPTGRGWYLDSPGVVSPFVSVNRQEFSSWDPLSCEVSYRDPDHASLVNLKRISRLKDGDGKDLESHPRIRNRKFTKPHKKKRTLLI